MTSMLSLLMMGLCCGMCAAQEPQSVPFNTTAGQFPATQVIPNLFVMFPGWVVVTNAACFAVQPVFAFGLDCYVSISWAAENKTLVNGSAGQWTSQP